ncbi:glutamate receptor 4-like [Panulirus ornatus]|uniref:glutamate receptor 4-like n=1 Tax=Panulirus ornatus TaxID=150431 RepID=UPI003A86412F
MGVRLVQRGSLPSGDLWHNLLPEELGNVMGHTFRVVTLEYFPFIAYRKNTDDPDGTLTPLDSLDTRVLQTIAAHLNFTYEMREPWDGTWGVPLAGGNWSGIVGTLQHEEADFSLNLTPSPARMEVITHSIIYSHDPLNILSLKPRTLPRSLALMRPFTNNLWMIIIVCTLSSGVILWLLQRAWSWVSGEPIFRLDSTLLQTLGVLLEEPADDPPENMSGQVFVGWWWLACVIIDTGYKSSLVAHLSVQAMFPPINTFEDILSRDGWAWGIQPLSGTTFLYFNQSSDPVIVELYKHFQYHHLQEGVEQVLAGGFSYVTLKSYLKIGTESRYRDRYGVTPFHLSTTEYSILGGNSWGFRRVY